MHSKYLITAICIIGMPAAQADEPLACANSLGTRLTDDVPAALPLDDPDVIQLETGRFEATLGDRPSATLSDGIVLRRGDKLAGAETARYDPDSRALYLTGDVRYEDPATQILSDSAEFEYDSGRIAFTGAEFSLGANNARGAAEQLQITGDGRLQLDAVSYTTCPPGSNDWAVEAADIDLDTRTGIGTAKGMKLRFQGVPVLYAPYLSFPISDARKSGVLTPEIGSTSRSGNELRVPYYWNIAPNYDATITPRLLTDRGLQLQSEFRYLTGMNDGVVRAEYLKDDSLMDENRYFGSFDHRTLFANRWRNLIHYREVSDSQYFEDLGGSLSVSSITHLDRNLRFDRYTDTLSLFAQVQDYQTIDDAIQPTDEPYRRVPQLLARGFWPDRMLGMSYRFTGEIVNFDRDVGVTGWRMNLAPGVELPFERPGWYVTPGVALDYTRYELDDTEPGQRTDPDRFLPIASIDTGMVLERLMTANGSARIQTIEPRVQYVHVPFREQDDFPVFDTITPDLSLPQLYRRNRYLGIDRIADTDQVSLGVTSRILDVTTGRELMTATVGQIRYLSTSGVALPGEGNFASESSDYIAEMRFLLYENVNFDFGYQWGTGGGGTTKSEARLQYRPATNKILNLAYRYRRDTLDQGDVSWSWPLGKRWNFVGRYNYSFREDALLEQFFGLEYESCCWGLRVVTRRYISTRDGTRDSSFGLQLVLKGFTSVGTAADKLLERGILGYSADLR